MIREEIDEKKLWTLLWNKDMGFKQTADALNL